jgi:hypothetical protein
MDYLSSALLNRNISCGEYILGNKSFISFCRLGTDAVQ